MRRCQVQKEGTDTGDPDRDVPMQYPFSGDVSIQPGPYEVVVTVMKERAAGRLNR